MRRRLKKRQHAASPTGDAKHAAADESTRAAKQQMQTLQQAMDMISECKGNCSGGQQGQPNSKWLKTASRDKNREMANNRAKNKANSQGRVNNQARVNKRPRPAARPRQPTWPRTTTGARSSAGFGTRPRQRPGHDPRSRAWPRSRRWRPPINPNDVKFRDTKSNQSIGQGAAQITGEAGGPNQKGNVQEQIKLEVEASKRETAKPSIVNAYPSINAIKSKSILIRCAKGSDFHSDSRVSSPVNLALSSSLSSSTGMSLIPQRGRRATVSLRAANIRASADTPPLPRV